jgi:hypothetical protein
MREYGDKVDNISTIDTYKDLSPKWKYVLKSLVKKTFHSNVTISSTIKYAVNSDNLSFDIISPNRYDLIDTVVNIQNAEEINVAE